MLGIVPTIDPDATRSMIVALVADAGHFLHREAPDLVTGEILRWVKS